MNESGKSDGVIVPKKLANNGRGAPRPAESVEERTSAKGNAAQQNRARTLRRQALQQALDRVRQAARKDKETRFTALWHHVYNIDRLHEAYLGLKRRSSAGVDRVTWQDYGKNLGENLQNLSERLKRGAYRAKPVRRVYIPKADGGQRPIGVPTLEDKIVQRATVEVLNAIYETDFLGFSYGFRPGRSQHHALDAVSVGLVQMKVNWVLDADIRGFFDAIDHECLMRFIEHRIGDRRVLRHVKKWLNAGVLEDGRLERAGAGTPQGGSISPLLANIYLHYALDLWVHQWRSRHAHGDVIIVRYADDFVVGFQYQREAERFWRELAGRLADFSLELHPDKTRLVEFGRFSVQNRKARGEGKPETFEFLGFTHIVDESRRGWFRVRRQTSRSRVQRKLGELKKELVRRRHWNPHEVGRWLRSVLLGHYRYYGVPLNTRALKGFKHQVERLWAHTLRRRSQRARRLTWKALARRFLRRWLPTPRIMHPWPQQRLRVNTQGRSPVR
jgi:group II intron reverse transcriptase/maturase